MPTLAEQILSCAQLSTAEKSEIIAYVEEHACFMNDAREVKFWMKRYFNQVARYNPCFVNLYELSHTRMGF